MTVPPSTIFRAEALQYRLAHHGQRRSDVTYPRLMARRFRVACWCLLLTFGLGGLLACLPAIPVSATGLAIVTNWKVGQDPTPLVAVLIPASVHGRFEPDTTARLMLGMGEHVGTIMAVESAPLSPAQAAQRLGLPVASLSMLQHQVTLLWAMCDSAASTSLLPGTAGQASLRTGSRRAGSFLPLIGRLFQE